MSPVSNSNNVLNNKFTLILYELFHPIYHGFDDNSDKNIKGHFLVHSCYHAFQLVENGIVYPDIILDDIQEDYYNYLRSRQIYTRSHPIIRNYRNIIENEKLMRPEIAQCITLSGGECVAILKTFWIRLIQRTWKRIYKEKQRIIILRSQPKSIYYRQIYGNWDKNCMVLPKLEGMIHYLK